MDIRAAGKPGGVFHVPQQERERHSAAGAGGLQFLARKAVKKRVLLAPVPKLHQGGIAHGIAFPAFQHGYIGRELHARQPLAQGLKTRFQTRQGPLIRRYARSRAVGQRTGSGGFGKEGVVTPEGKIMFPDTAGLVIQHMQQTIATVETVKDAGKGIGAPRQGKFGIDTLLQGDDEGLFGLMFKKLPQAARVPKSLSRRLLPRRASAGSRSRRSAASKAS